METTIFDNDDTAYLAWAQANPLGFVLNRYRVGTSTSYLVLHRATCNAVTKPRQSEPGEFTQRGYIKVCSTDLEELRTYARSVGRIDGSFSKVCKLCGVG
ncbi:hypothetical protein [Paraburkholderia unamae]|uniref:Uncharacterized protein n=1 Tax=Paraburkholderia unamae TaxID=219649 RepID=A0ABX5KPK4_9BURK|nr:hypothetical protein [Paraburkholderia unamae]PVX82458.1 hypothetical protein C7402_109312 [Paraburkholderia unamae]